VIRVAASAGLIVICTNGKLLAADEAASDIKVSDAIFCTQISGSRCTDELVAGQTVPISYLQTDGGNPLIYFMSIADRFFPSNFLH